MFTICQGAQPDISIQFNDVNNNVNSASIPLSALSTTVTADGFTHILLNFASIPPNGLPLVRFASPFAA